MSILTPAPGERFNVRVYKYWEGNYENEWSNVYHLVGVAEPDYATLIESAENILAWERLLHDGRITFARIIVSTGAPDSDPYDGNEYVIVPATGTGARAPGLLGDILPLTQVRFVRFAPSLGRSSLLGYRGSMYEGEVNASSGRQEFDNPSDQALMIDSFEASTIAGMVASPGAPFELCSGSVSARPIVSVSSARPGYLPMKHKWYNQTSA